MSGSKHWIAGQLPKRGQPKSAPSHRPSDKQLEKLTRLMKRELVGRPLTEALHHANTTTPGHDQRPRRSIAGAIIAVGAILLAAIFFEQQWLVGAAAAGITVVLLWVIRSRHSAPLLSTGLANDDIHQLDAYLQEVSPLLPQSALAKLTGIKETLAKTLPALCDADRAREIPLEDRFFAGELVRRYLPDACRHYAALTNVGPAIADPEMSWTAEQSLCNQLDVLQTRLENTWKAIVATQAQKLASHEAFIEMKGKH